MSFKYVAKPVEIEAVPADIANGTETKSIPAWFVDAAVNGTIYYDEGNEMCTTKQGPVQINPGDYLIRLQDGEIYPCNPTTFHAKYQSI